MSRLKLLLLLLGDWAYAVLISLGWQPREQREGNGQPPSSM